MRRLSRRRLELATAGLIALSVGVLIVASLSITATPSSPPRPLPPPPVDTPETPVEQPAPASRPEDVLARRHDPKAQAVCRDAGRRALESLGAEAAPEDALRAARLVEGLPEDVVPLEELVEGVHRATDPAAAACLVRALGRRARRSLAADLALHQVRNTARSVHVRAEALAAELCVREAPPPSALAAGRALLRETNNLSLAAALRRHEGVEAVAAGDP